MREYYRNNLTALFFLEAQALLWVFWSFKMHRDMFSGTPGDGDGDIHYDNPIIQHSGSGILSAGVCPLGKFGAWMTLIWGIILLAVLTKHYSDDDTNKIKTINKIMGWINIVLVFIMFVLSLIMNPPLWIRTLPFVFVQIAITIILLNDCSKM
jgi:hypothetical protein